MGLLEVGRHAIDDTRDLEIPTMETELRSLIGSCNLLPQFVPFVTVIVYPFTARVCRSQTKELVLLKRKELTALPILQRKVTFPQYWPSSGK